MIVWKDAREPFPGGRGMLGGRRAWRGPAGARADSWTAKRDAAPPAPPPGGPTQAFESPSRVAGAYRDDG